MNVVNAVNIKLECLLFLYLSCTQVNENGIISFDGSFHNPYPQLFPVDGSNSFVIAPYWSDNDIRRDGEVRYVTYSQSNSMSDIFSGSAITSSDEQGQTLLDKVNAFVQARQSEIEDRFVGNWLLVVHWDHVHPSPHGEATGEESDISVSISPNLELVRHVINQSLLVLLSKCTLSTI